eukprot:TRINITY_DN6578_c0_g1_i1.p1 TRINITY_DN6578_c0_g1~~TRINITY_DN6578_c0_g1_i1.p1  ORF type:complete len:359 (+),score=83.36 TRINITY_DN6578_c0_g1_i1:200-1276(+)
MGFFSPSPAPSKDDVPDEKPVKDVLPQDAPDSFRNLDFYRNLHIQTDSDCYWGGDKIVGRVYYFNTNPTELTGFVLELNCVCTTIETSSDGKTKLSHDSNYVNRKITLIKEKTTLSAGYHVFPFSIPLEPFVVGTFKIVASMGQVRWKLEARIEKDDVVGYLAGLFGLSKLSKDIQVITSPSPLLHLEKSMAYKPPAKADPVYVSFEILNTVCSNKIDVTVNINNQWSNSINGFTLSLKGKYLIKNPRRVRTETVICTRSMNEKIPSGSKYTKVITLDIPPTVATFQSASFDAEHFIRLKVHKGIFHPDIELRNLPVTILASPKPLETSNSDQVADVVMDSRTNVYSPAASKLEIDMD